MPTSLIGRQTWALIRRYYIHGRWAPISFLFKFILWPSLWVFLFYKFILMYVIKQSTENGQESNDYYSSGFTPKVEVYLTYLLQITLTLNLYSHVNFMVTDKSSGMKSLMISVGLRRTPYYLANFICFMTKALPIITFVGVISAVYLFQGSSASRLTIILVFVLFVLHLSGLMFVLNSMLKIPSLASLILIATVMEYPVHTLFMFLAKRSFSPEFVLFLAASDPYESVRLFIDSYAFCKNNGLSPTLEKDGNVCLSSHLLLIAMCFWTVVAYLFALWFDVACPWQTDTANGGLLYCLRGMANNDKKIADMDLSQQSNHSKYFERSVSNRQVGISIRHVSKEFSGKSVISDLSFNIYRGETTLLLGHNGAGKTTLMNIILGKLMPNQGQVRINKVSERGADNGVGVCPQTSVYDNFLSVRQHMDLFSMIKSNLNDETRQRDIDTTLTDVSLDNKADSLPSELSGGMRRKLSLGIAFVGKSSILILDEPSSGLDPDSRVFVWNAIRRYRADRTVLLSTQHMEEADYLGDRIAIMSDGQIICCGSSVFLTKILGSGYKLRVECLPTSSKSILELVRRHFVAAKLAEEERIVDESMSKRELSLLIELKSEQAGHTEDLELNLIKLLEEIETQSNDLGIKAYGLRSSSIEDVLLNTTKLLHEESKSSVRLSIDTSIVSLLETLINPKLRRRAVGFSDLTYFLVAFLKKHISSYKNDWLTVLFYRVGIVALACWLSVRDIHDELHNASYTPSRVAYLIIFHFLSSPLKERVSKFKIMQLTTQTNVYIYWISQLVMDMLTILVATVLLNIFLETNSDLSFGESKMLVHLMASGGMLLFGLAGALNCYVLSTFLSDSKTGTAYVIIYFLIGIFVSQLLVPVIMLTFQVDKSIDPVQKVAQMIFIIVYPTEALQYFLYGLTIDGYIKPGFKTYRNPQPSSSLSPLYVGSMALIGQTVVFGLLLYLIESRNLDPSNYICRLWNCLCPFRRSASTNDCIIPEGQIDGDVLEERRKARIAIDSQRETYKLVASDLSKSYLPGIKVVDQLSFTVKEGECFGLLGVNGAGKSTTFSMLVGERKLDSGRIWLSGLYSDTDLHAYRQKLGYDPQENPTISLNPGEALTLMARLRRVEEHNIPALVNCMLLVLDMIEHVNKSCNQLSGGTMRKLALGMSLIGNPELLALDEPTAGVDPVARRGIWQLLRSMRTRKNISIVISSHAMEECEAICDRISIMARGRLRCIGTFLHLRSKFAQGCVVKIRCNPGGNMNDFASIIVPDLTRRLQNLAGYSVRLTDLNINSANFNILTQDLKRSSLFKLMREFNSMHRNLNYTVNDSSLEDVFLTMAREQQPGLSSKRSADEDSQQRLLNV